MAARRVNFARLHIRIRRQPFEIGVFFEDYFNASGFLYFMWVVPYGVAVAILAVFFLKFVLALPTQTRTRFILAGILYLGGAIGLEVFGAVRPIFMAGR